VAEAAIGIVIGIVAATVAEIRDRTSRPGTRAEIVLRGSVMTAMAIVVVTRSGIGVVVMRMTVVVTVATIVAVAATGIAARGLRHGIQAVAGATIGLVRIATSVTTSMVTDDQSDSRRDERDSRRDDARDSAPRENPWKKKGESDDA
jgi:hypothetical protein